MTKLLHLPRTKISTIEIDNNLSGETISVLPFLPKEHKLSFIIGSDQLTMFHVWSDWQKLLTAMPFLIFPRYGYPNEPLYENMHVISHELLVGSNISSTKIRERVKLGLSVEEFVPVAVSEYINKHGLYIAVNP